MQIARVNTLASIHYRANSGRIQETAKKTKFCSSATNLANAWTGKCTGKQHVSETTGLARPHNEGLTTDDVSVVGQYKQLQLDKFCVKLSHGDCHVQLMHGDIVSVQNIIAGHDRYIVIIYRKFEVDGDLFTYPVESRTVGIVQLASGVATGETEGDVSPFYWGDVLGDMSPHPLTKVSFWNGRNPVRNFKEWVSPLCQRGPSTNCSITMSLIWIKRSNSNRIANCRAWKGRKCVSWTLLLI